MSLHLVLVAQWIRCWARKTQTESSDPWPSGSFWNIHCKTKRSNNGGHIDIFELLIGHIKMFKHSSAVWLDLIFRTKLTVKCRNGEKQDQIFSIRFGLFWLLLCWRVSYEEETMPAVDYRGIPEKVEAERRVWTSCWTEVISNLSSPGTTSGSVQKPKCNPDPVNLEAEHLPEGFISSFHHTWNFWFIHKGKIMWSSANRKEKRSVN